MWHGESSESPIIIFAYLEMLKTLLGVHLFFFCKSFRTKCRMPNHYREFNLHEHHNQPTISTVHSSDWISRRAAKGIQWIVPKTPHRKQKGNQFLSLSQVVAYLECPPFLRKGPACIRDSGGLFSWISADCPFVSFFILTWLAGNCPSSK